MMQISITDDLKKRFHAACALHGLKMSHVVVEMIEQWLKTNEVNLSSELKERESVAN
ncbi:MAG: plasmid partition protein ParG [Nostoc sp.]